MRSRLTGVREIIKGQRYEINYMVGGRRCQYRINAASLSEAHDKKLADMADKRKNASLLLGSEERACLRRPYITMSGPIRGYLAILEA